MIRWARELGAVLCVALGAALIVLALVLDPMEGRR